MTTVTERPTLVPPDWMPPQRDEEWMLRAVCRNRRIDPDNDPYYPVKGTPNRSVAEAKRLCRTLCPVRDECLEYALLYEPAGERYGIWGGTSPMDRRRIVRDRKQARKASA